MNEKNDGGLAFPVTVDQRLLGGMSFRDYFAGKAMQGLIVDVGEPNYEGIADMSYRMADAMLKAREL